MFKRRIKNWLIKELWCAVTPEMVVTQDKKGVLYLAGEKMSEDELRIVKEEIKFLERTKIWQIFTQTVRYDAQKMMFTNAKTTDDLFAGKMILYCLSLFDNIIKEFKRH